MEKNCKYHKLIIQKPVKKSFWVFVEKTSVMPTGGWPTKLYHTCTTKSRHTNTTEKKRYTSK